MFDIHRPRHQKIVAVADISSGGATMGILESRSGTPSRLIAIERSVPTMEERSEEATVKEVANQILITGEKIQKKYADQIRRGKRPFADLIVVLHEPLIRSRTIRGTSFFREATTMREGMIEELAEKTLLKETSLNRKDIVEASIIRIELNGYPCTKPLGKRAMKLAISALVSEIEPNVRTEIESSLRKVFPHLSPVFRSAIRSSTAMIQEIVGKEKDYLIVDMANGGTTLTTVRDGVITEHEMVTEGTYTIIKRVAASGMPEETLSMLRMLAREQCSGPACDAIRTSVATTEPLLVRTFGDAMTKCAAKRRLPNTLILLAHPDLLPWMSKFFSRIDFAQFTLTTQPFSVRNFKTEDIQHIVRTEEGVDLDPDIAMVCGLVNTSTDRQ